MAPPPWVLLNRKVNFVDGGFAGGAGKAAAAIGGSSGERSVEESLAAMEPHPIVAEPPQVTSLSMLRLIPPGEMRRVRGGMISSTDKGLVVLYAGMYRPGNGAYSPAGCYLVYDASSNSLSSIPPLDPPTSLGPLPVLPTIKSLGPSAAILRLGHGGEGAYVLAELVATVHPGLPDAELYLWSSTANSDGQWMRTAVRLPLPPKLCGPTYFFHVDMAFSIEGSRVCWVDLLTGVLICDLFTPQGPEFSFIPLPQGYSLYTPDNIRLGLKPQEFRSMGRVCGAIKFVALIGYTEGSTGNELVLKTWTLSTDLKEWKKGSTVLVGDLWASESFSQMKLPRVRPMFPVLSMNEDDIVYVFLNDVKYVDSVNYCGQIVGRQLMLNGHYVLRLELVRNKVLCSKKSTTNNLALLAPTLLASDFSAYLHGSKDRQRGRSQ
ncbi:unnamed protein product [Urochloa decumbens]|uniref:DUF1618 domain-containing protein n=1 Tax=Urochloa decumbens TaxID=240449 RepID=A0ABC9CV56_9POAL